MADPVRAALTHLREARAEISHGATANAVWVARCVGLAIQGVGARASVGRRGRTRRLDGRWGAGGLTLLARWTVGTLTGVLHGRAEPARLTVGGAGPDAACLTHSPQEYRHPNSLPGEVAWASTGGRQA